MLHIAKNADGFVKKGFYWMFSNWKKYFISPKSKKILIFMGLLLLAIILGQLAAIFVLKALFTT
ncbi:hypothetical protein [Streptococcus loxodontisalivarius]|uniref:Uncharacterized protein n=1 Tax=Streptococcus loxodontisalivarius TaxID=1349415 RepID=A0ABS2PRX6_9STRE|nr:hypothetical protein [Streptococcus loxodontisalivarius]MBM7642683.1 hypothetical protein [Streptococcus loxodontisalivarius]